MKSDDTVVVVAFGCQFLDKPIPGSIIGNCNDCNEEVWIAPSWQGKKIDRIVCMNCYKEYVGKDSYKGEKTKIKTCIAEEQLEEFNVYCKKNYGYTMTKDEVLIMLEEELGRKVIFKDSANE